MKNSKRGRPKGSFGTNNRKKISLTLPNELVLWLREQDLSQAKIVEKALIQYRLKV